jgi:hypothetical protein
VVALLVHNDFASKALELLKAENVLPLTKFDPRDPKHLMKPEFKDATIEVRTQEMQSIFENQIHRTLDFLRPPVKLSVARDFHKKGWINATYLEDLTHLHASTQQHTGNSPRNNSFRTDEEEDTNMDNSNDKQEPQHSQQPQPTQQAQLDLTTPMEITNEHANSPNASNPLAGGGEPALIN